MKRIGMVLDNPFPPDIRVEKEARALLKAGFEVALLSLGGTDEITGYGLKIIRRSVRASAGFQRNIQSLTLIDPAWQAAIRNFISEIQLDALHIHDFTLVPAALSVAQTLPVIADLHENMPAAHRIWRADAPIIPRFKDSLKYNYYIWKYHERKALRRCSRVIVVVPEAAERVRKYGIAPEKIVLVSNTEDETTFHITPPDASLMDRYAKRWVVCYTGGLGAHRGLDTAIKAVAQVGSRIPGLRLLIVGAKEDRRSAALRQLICDLRVQDRVDIIGWQPADKVGAYISLSAACLVPHNDTEHTQTTVPHKLFQYMLCGKAVIASDVRPLKRILDETQAGLVFKANDPASLAEMMIQLYGTPGLKEQLGENGRRAALGSHSWKHDAERLVRLYHEL